VLEQTERFSGAKEWRQMVMSSIVQRHRRSSLDHPGEPDRHGWVQAPGEQLDGNCSEGESRFGRVHHFL
jgi:methionine synthase II (cobalamin-independent)